MSGFWEGIKKRFSRVGGISQELEFHIQMQTERNIQDGMSPAEAKRAALISLGGVERTRERTREETRGYWLQTVLQDLRYGSRALRRSPGFTTLAILTLALGVGATTAIFSVVNGVLLKNLPYENPSELYELRERTERGTLTGTSVLNFQDWHSQSNSFDGMAAFSGIFNTTVLGGVEPVVAAVRLVSADFFSTLGMSPAIGRVLGPNDHQPGSPTVAVVSHSFWLTNLEGNQDIGQIFLDLGSGEGPSPVVGVMPDEFHSPADADVWVSLDRSPPWNVRGNHVLRVLARRSGDIPEERAQAELTTIVEGIQAEFSTETDAVGILMVSMRDRLLATSRPTILTLLGAATLLLLIACGNLASLFLARGLSGAGDLTVRSALGAGRGRLVQFLFVQGTLLAVIGGGLGVLLGFGLLAGVMTLASQFLPPTADVAVSVPVLVFALSITAISVLLFALLPALSLTRSDLASKLRVAGGNHRRRGWNALLAAEIALAFTLLAGTGLIGRSVLKILSTDVGYETAGVVRAELTIPTSRYSDDVLTRNLFSEISRELLTIPGVEDVGTTNLLPIHAGQIIGPITLADGTRPEQNAEYRVVDDRYFSALDIPLLEGRVFDGRDGPDDPHVVIVNQSLAQTIWPDDGAIGQRFSIPGMDPYGDTMTVIGVVEDARHWSAPVGSQLTYHMPLAQRPVFARIFSMSVLVESSLPSSDVIPAVRAKMASIDSDIPLRFEELDLTVGRTTANRRLTLIVLGLLGVAGLLLVSIGVAGVVSYSVTRRTREAGIRIALGASPGSVRTLFVKGSGGFVIVGTVAGILLSAALSRWLQSLLFSVEPLDPLVFGSIAGLVAIVAVGASYIPTRRITSIEASSTIRAES